jgi:hypothetical protein
VSVAGTNPASSASWFSRHDVKWVFPVDDFLVAMCQPPNFGDAYHSTYDSLGTNRRVLVPNIFGDAPLYKWVTAPAIATPTKVSRSAPPTADTNYPRVPILDGSCLAIDGEAVVGVSAFNGPTWLFRLRPSTGKSATMMIRTDPVDFNALFGRGKTLGAVLNRGFEIQSVPWDGGDATSRSRVPTSSRADCSRRHPPQSRPDR